MTTPPPASPKRPRRTLLWKLRAWGRVLAYLGVINLIGLVWLVSAARGAVGEKAMDLGRNLERLSRNIQGANAVNINGQTMFVAVDNSDVPVEEALDRFEEGCRNQNAGVADLLKDLPQAEKDKLREKLEGKPLSSLGVISERQGQGADMEGAVVCIVSTDEQRKVPLRERVSRFLQSWDLAEIGEFRYLYALKRNGKPGSHLRLFWTEGSFNFVEMLSDGSTDAPGTDPTSASRPPGSVRLINAHVSGVPHELWLYRSHSSQEAILAEYDRTMQQPDWRPNPFVKLQTPFARHFTSSQGNDFVVHTDVNEDGTTSVTIVESSMGNRELKPPKPTFLGER
jgi:hypothetical protein